MIRSLFNQAPKSAVSSSTSRNIGIKQALVALFVTLATPMSVLAAHHSDDDKAQAEATQPVKAVLITGATSGLGLKMTEVLSKNGFLVYAGGRAQDDLDRLEAMENVEAIKLDVTSAEDMAAAVATVKAKGRGLYGLINNAGLSIFGPMTEVPHEQVEFLFDVNVLGPYRVTQAFAPMLIESKGRLFTTGSVAGSGTSPMMGQYSMSKHAVEAMVDGWNNELAHHGIKVGVVEPGNFASNIGNAALARLNSIGYWSEDTAYPEQREGYFQGLSQVDKGADPLPVAEAALDFMSSDTPKVRYMVTPNPEQAERIIRKLISRVAQQNNDHEHALNRETLIKLLDEELAKQR